jgi:hypothetical protein
MNKAINNTIDKGIFFCFSIEKDNIKKKNRLVGDSLFFFLLEPPSVQHVTPPGASEQTDHAKVQYCNIQDTLLNVLK